MIKNKVLQVIMGLLLSFTLLVFCPLYALAIRETGISISNQAITLNMGTPQTLKAVITPSSATNKNVKWTSSNSAVATIDTHGKITPVSVGTSNIIATTDDGSFTATCVLAVQTGVAKIALNKSTDIIVSGATDTLTTMITPTN